MKKTTDTSGRRGEEEGNNAALPHFALLLAFSPSSPPLRSSLSVPSSEDKLFRDLLEAIFTSRPAER